MASVAPWSRRAAMSVITTSHLTQCLLLRLPRISSFRLYAFPCWCSPSQIPERLVIPISVILPLSSFYIFLLSQGYAIVTCQSQAWNAAARTPRERSREAAAVGIRERVFIKVYPTVPPLTASTGKADCPLRRYPAQSYRCSCATIQMFCLSLPTLFSLEALWTLPLWFYLIVWRIRVPKGWHLPFCTTS